MPQQQGYEMLEKYVDFRMIKTEFLFHKNVIYFKSWESVAKIEKIEVQ